MIDRINSHINFGAKFDPQVTQKLFERVSNDKRLTNYLERQINIINNWGDKDSLITLGKGKYTDRDQFILSNEKLGGDNTVGISRTISGEESSIFIAFLDISKKSIVEAERILKNS